MKFKNSNAFTIVELIIVITIIGILATIAIVSYSGSQKQASKSSFNATAQQVKLKLGDYYTDNNKYPSIKGTSASDADSVLKYLSDTNSTALSTSFTSTYGSPATQAFSYTACLQGTNQTPVNPCVTSNCDNQTATTMCGMYSILVQKAAWRGNPSDSDIVVGS